VVVASHEGVPVAGAVVAVCGDTAFYLFGASTDAALPLRAGYALHWWIVSWAADRGARWYDLGGEAMSEGLRQFKKGLVGKRGAVLTMRGEFDRWTSRRGRLVADCIYALRDLGRTTRGVRERLSARPRATA
jgi:lipid II:glycine glycyltransferase (peptidoglycan interpeptide bridge formation enzyme)